MFDIGYSELLVVAIVALVVIGPKDLPRVMRTVGQWVGRARGMARHFRSGVDTMIREAELEEMEKKWREENERIMRDHPDATSWDDPPLAGEADYGLPAPGDIPAPNEPPVAPPTADASAPDASTPDATPAKAARRVAAAKIDEDPGVQAQLPLAPPPAAPDPAPPEDRAGRPLP